MPDSVLGRLSPACFRPMRKIRAVAAALACAALALPLYAGMQQKEDNRHQIDKLEDAWRNALVNSDTKMMDGLLAPDYMAITASGTLQSKDETLANMRAGQVHFTLLDIVDRKVRFYGSTAVVTSQ